MKIVHLRTNHIENPLGYLLDSVTFSYKVVEAKGKRQVAAQIIVSKSADMSDVVFDSGERADIDSIAFAANLDLEPRTRYYWTVRVVTDAGEQAASDTAWFETGKLDELWAGQWLFSDLDDSVHPIFFKDIVVTKTVKCARLYVCGLGLYEAYFNGQKVSDEFLTPYCNDYTQWLQYQSYDVTDMLPIGKARLDVLLGNGWYKGRFGLDDDGSTKHLYGDTFVLIAELYLDYADGSHEVIATDESWMARKSKILESSFYNGEVYDETLSDETVYPVQLWTKPMARLSERLSLPIRVQETLKPTRLIHTPKNEWVLDLGQNHSGWFKLQVDEPRGAKLQLFFGEELQDGCFYNGNLRTGKQEYTYISDGTPRTIRPHFTTYGYRYVKLEGFTNQKLEHYCGWVLYSDLEETGRIETANPLVNRLVLNSMWGQKSNFLDVPMDCPQRDERMGWTGDAQVFARAACYNMDSYAFYRKYLYDMNEEQKHRRGAVPFVVPACGQEGSCGIWGDAATIIPFAVYESYGDKRIMQDQYASMKAWVDYVRKENGDDWRWRRIFHFGDWLALDSRSSALPTGGTDTGYVATVYYYHSTVLVAKAAKILGKTEDAKTYELQAEELLQAIHSEYFTATGRLSIDTQTGYLTALKFGLAPLPERTRQDLRQSFFRNSDKLETGFVGTSMLCNVLSENGMNDLAYSLLLNEEYPGWLLSVKLGATTIWERWDSLDENGHFSSSGLNSLNHYSYGAIVEWLFRHAAGLAPRLENPGFREVDLEPKPDYRLGMIDARFDSPIGVYRSRWAVTESFGLRLDIEVPFGGTAYLALPFAPESLCQNLENPIFAHVVETDKGLRCVLQSGVYSIEYETVVPMRMLYDVSSTIAVLMADEQAKAVVMKVLPMISMLPQSMYNFTLKDLLARANSAISTEQIEQINQLLRT